MIRVLERNIFQVLFKNSKELILFIIFSLMTFHEVVEILQREGIDFYVTGSFAIYLYTKQRQYNDIDLVIKAEDIPQIEKLFNVKSHLDVSHFSETYASVKVGDIEFCDFNIRKGNKTYFFGLDDKYYAYKYAYFEGLKFKIVDPEELVVFKIFHSRQTKGKRDLEDAKLLIKTLEIDWMKVIVLSYKYKVLDKVSNFVFKLYLEDLKDEYHLPERALNLNS